MCLNGKIFLHFTVKFRRILKIFEVKTVPHFLTIFCYAYQCRYLFVQNNISAKEWRLLWGADCKLLHTDIKVATWVICSIIGHFDLTSYCTTSSLVVDHRYSNCIVGYCSIPLVVLCPNHHFPQCNRLQWIFALVMKLSKFPWEPLSHCNA